MEYRIIYKDELYHHGVKGMKWGVRKERSTSTGGDKKKKGLSAGQKVAIGVAAVAVTGAVLYKTGSFDRVASAGKQVANRHKAKKLGLELVQNTERSSSNFDKAMSRMNEAFDSGRGTFPAFNSLDVNSLHRATSKSNPKEISNIAQVGGSLKVKRGGPANGARLTYASNRLMTPFGAESEKALRNHTKALKLSSDISNHRISDVATAASRKRSFDARGDAAAKARDELLNKSIARGKFPGYYSNRKVPSLKSTASSRVGKSAVNKIQSSMSYKNLTYADLEKLDLF